MRTELSGCCISFLVGLLIVYWKIITARSSLYMLNTRYGSEGWRTTSLTRLSLVIVGTTMNLMNMIFLSAGFFVCNRKVLDYLISNEDLMLEQEPITNIVKDGQLMVFKHAGFWHPMDTARDYQLLNKMWEEGGVPWKI